MTTPFERRANICARKCTEALVEKCRLSAQQSTLSRTRWKGMILNSREFGEHEFDFNLIGINLSTATSKLSLGFIRKR